MKKVAISAVAIISLLSSTSALAAGNHPQTTTFGTSNTAPAPNWDVSAFDATTGQGGIPNDTDTDQKTVTAAFTLTGTVEQNCSYYAGPGGLTQTVGLGDIGIKNGNNQNIGQLFNQVDQIDVEITSTNAGCNTDNTLTVSKSAQGLVNGSPGGYDTNQFTANIPYDVVVGITSAVPAHQTGQGTFQGFTVGLNAASNHGAFGAWRSSLDLRAEIPPQSKGLVAGNYQDTITVTLAAGVV
jgi:hypothetical protein